MGKVKLRKKEISNERYTLFLDIWPPVVNPATGKFQRKHYLKLFTYKKAKNRLEREHNTETMNLAENIRAKRQLDIQNLRFDFLNEERFNANFIDFLQMQADKRKGNYNWKMTVQYFKAFAGEKVTFKQMTENLCEEFSEYLLSSPTVGRSKRNISVNTAVSYFSRFRRTLKEANKKGLLLVNLYERVEPIALKETHRPFLFLEELQQMAHAHCSSLVVKRAGLFSALTGLRFSDIQDLKWSEIIGSAGFYHIQFIQEKTSGAVVLPISDQAYSLLGPRDGSKYVFANLDYKDVTKHLPEWLKEAGIEKHFTFHGFRHTYATLQLAAGTDIYTVSKMLGHKTVKTTEIYVKIVDKLKVAAAARIQLELNNVIEIGLPESGKI